MVADKPAANGDPRWKRDIKELAARPLYEIPGTLARAAPKGLRAAISRKPPPVDVRAVDKAAFCLGVVGCSVTQWLFIDRQHLISLWYSALIVPLLAIRWYSYLRQRFQYFLLDFCYLTQGLLLVHIHLLPCSRPLHFALFSMASGPIPWAVFAWRNSLVFHSVDKITSAAIHVLPLVVMHNLHWEPRCGGERPGWDSERAPWTEWLGAPLVVYGLWQAAYVLAVDVVSAPEMRRDRTLLTSVRKLASKPYSPLALWSLRAARALRVMGPAEEFDADSPKTKAVFMAVQLLYTVASILPVGAGLVRSRRAHLAFLIALLLLLTWNGANYYFEVFSRRYEEELERRRAKAKRGEEGQGAVRAEGNAGTGGAGAGADGEPRLRTGRAASAGDAEGPGAHEKPGEGSGAAREPARAAATAAG